MKKFLTILLTIIVIAGVVAGVCAIINKVNPNTALANLRPMQKGDKILGFTFDESKLQKLDWDTITKDIEPVRFDLEKDGEYIDKYIIVEFEDNSESNDYGKCISYDVVTMDGETHYGLCIFGQYVLQDGAFCDDPSWFENCAGESPDNAYAVVSSVKHSIKLIGAIKPIYFSEK